MVDQNEDHREQRRKPHVENRARRNQQQTDREQASIDVEMPERMHEILGEKRRAGHEDEQRQMLIVKPERAAE